MRAMLTSTNRSTTEQPTFFSQSLPPRQEMEQAFLSSDASYDGIFFTGVRTTGIFCRPSCRARKPLPSNVEFFGSVRDALFAGYRPCHRCHPTRPSGSAPGWVTSLLEAIETDPHRRLRDADLRRIGVEPARARRYFLEHYGMTFQAYCRGRRLGGALRQLRSGADLDDVALGTGWDSHSGFREAFTERSAHRPARAKRHHASSPA